MENDLHVYTFEVRIAVGGLGTTSYTSVKKSVLAHDREEAINKLNQNIELSVVATTIYPSNTQY